MTEGLLDVLMTSNVKSIGDMDSVEIDHDGKSFKLR